MTLHRYAHRVTYSDCTVGNHVYYGRYLQILEAARGEFFRAIGYPLLQLQQEDTILPVVECRLRYKAAARYDDLLAVELWVGSLERVRLQFEYRVVREQAAADILHASTAHACTSIDEKIKRLPENLSAALAKHLAPDINTPR